MEPEGCRNCPLLDTDECFAEVAFLSNLFDKIDKEITEGADTISPLDLEQMKRIAKLVEGVEI